MAIPIRNIYYLLCYAWDRWREGREVDVSAVDGTELADLYAKVLIDGTRRLLRRGPDRGYVEEEDDLARVRGRILPLETARRQTLLHGRVACRFEELSSDVLHNRILRSTLRRLAATSGLDRDLRHELLGLHRSLPDVAEIRLSRMLFRRVQIHGNNRVYALLMNVCETILDGLLVDEASGTVRFRDFEREQLPALFEDFLFNFYRIETDGYFAVGRPSVGWALDDRATAETTLLPAMQTDIVLRSQRRTIVIDAKFYRETMQVHHDTAKVRSGHLYQLFAYLRNGAATGQFPANVEGMLVYPRVDATVRADWRVHGHRMRACTVDLHQEWRAIHDEFAGLVT